MSEDRSRPVPPSASELLDADDDTAETLIVAYIDACLRRAPGDPNEEFSKLPRGMQYVYSTAILEGEVENGGFNQYFFNSTSDFALEALQGYREFGASDHARIVRDAIDVFHRERWLHFRIKLRRSLESFFDSYQITQLSEIDAQFYELEDDPVALRGQYIRNNLSEFVR